MNKKQKPKKKQKQTETPSEATSFLNLVAHFGTLDWIGFAVYRYMNIRKVSDLYALYGWEDRMKRKMKWRKEETRRGKTLTATTKRHNWRSALKTNAEYTSRLYNANGIHTDDKSGAWFVMYTTRAAQRVCACASNGIGRNSISQYIYMYNSQ